ncbi:alpha/beta hydrolase [Xanthobacter agilis]|uniref:Acetyl esterase/lipase n=1 Tax=Xanthobacter agilis TaxID=47492 RepID=A0ABU0LII5_XANAG|nr:alpha/beta hydrolase [Xanthobacter agilis]MDQ0506952.1 acetyl esterase/lipase [Xanthobacter agilis]
MIDRRAFLAVAAALAVGAQRATAQPVAGDPAPVETIPLWPGTPPGGGGPSGPAAVSPGGAMSHVAIPAIEIHRPAQPGDAAVLIAAGGGYRQIQMDKEARPAARWLAARGITAFILMYRLPSEGWRERPLAPLQDAQRALRLMRAAPPPRGVAATRIGVLGFSAGGHLLGLAATRADFRSYAPVDAIDRQSARPDAAALIYPVITLEPPYDQTSTRRQLIGSHPSPRQSAEWSVQTHVRAGCPPMFLVQAEDDSIANPQNTVILAQACRRAGVPVELHQLARGGHGFGMGKPGTVSAEWPRWYENWLRAQRTPA